MACPNARAGATSGAAVGGTNVGWAVTIVNRPLQSACRFRWFVSREVHSDEIGEGKKVDRRQLTWTERQEGPAFTPGPEDLGRFIKATCTPGDADGRKGPEFSAVSGCAVSAGPGPCPFELRHAFTPATTADKEVRCATYLQC